jgi:hypothetical protein
MKLACILILSLLAGCGQVGGVSMSKPAGNLNSDLEKTLWDVDQP